MSSIASSHVSHHRLQLHMSVTTACSHCAVMIPKEAPAAFISTNKLPPSIHQVQGVSQVFVDIRQHHIVQVLPSH